MFHVLLLLLCCILLLVKHWHLYALKKQKIAESGCKPVAKIPLKDKLGIKKLGDHVRARKEHRWPSFLIETLEDAGEHVYTASHRAINHDMFYTRDLENIKAVLNAPQSDFILGDPRGANFVPVLGGGLFTAEGRAWQHYRSCARSLFTLAKQESNLNAMEMLLREKFASMSKPSDDWTEEVDLQALFLDLMLGVTSDLLFGNPKDSREQACWHHDGSGQPDTTTFVESLDLATTYVGNRTVLGRLYWVQQSQEFRRHCKVIQTYIDRCINTFQKERQVQDKNGRLLGNDYIPGEDSDPAELRNLTQPILFTGRSTTGALIAVTLYHLMQDPLLYDSLRHAVISTFGHEGNIRFSHLNCCEILNFCIMESLRLGSIVPAIIRSANRDFVLPRGGGSDQQSPVFVSKGSNIIVCIQALHLRTDLWGEDAATYNPDRWRRYRFEWSFLPFGKGRRQCIGRGFSALITSY